MASALVLAAACAGCSAGESPSASEGTRDAGQNDDASNAASTDATVPPNLDAAAGDGDSSESSAEDGETEANDGSTSDAPTDAAIDDGADGPSSDSAIDASPSVDCSTDAGGAIGPSGAPALLACTGLYADWASRTIAANVIAYDPGLHLWSDGAVKTRYIALPPGAQIDTSDMDEWIFPIGTKIWKQFVVAGKKVETRYLLKLGTSNWVYTTYQWSADETTAVELTTGALNVNGTGYEIPYLDECRVCHMGRLDFVLGFEAIALSTPGATGVTMASLVANGWITAAPAAPLVIPGDATAVAALGWLHANCGTACHNSSKYSLAGSTGFFMRLDASKLASVQATNTYATGVNVVANFKEPDGGTLKRIAPGNPGGSCVVFRDSYRDTQGEGIQMPPNDTHVVDTADVAIVKSWIESL